MVMLVRVGGMSKPPGLEHRAQHTSSSGKIRGSTGSILLMVVTVASACHRRFQKQVLAPDAHLPDIPSVILSLYHDGNLEHRVCTYTCYPLLLPPAHIHDTTAPGVLDWWIVVNVNGRDLPCNPRLQLIGPYGGMWLSSVCSCEVVPGDRHRYNA